MSNSFRSKTGRFTVSGNGSYSITGVGFQPKIVLFMSYGAESQLDVIISDAGLQFGYGISSSDRGCIGVYSADNVGTTATGTQKNTNLCLKVMRESTGTVSYDVDFTSMDADGFTVTVSNAVAGGYVMYLALGGNDLEVDAGFFSVTTGTGSQSVTGIGFEPEALMTLFPRVTGTTENPALFSMGLTDGESQYCQAFHSEDNVGLSNSRRRIQEAMIYNYDDTGGVDIVAEFTSFDSDGFTINKTQNDYLSNYDCMYIALRGVQFHVGYFLTQTSTGEFTYSDCPFTPKTGIFMMGNINAMNNGLTDINNGIAFIDENEESYALNIFDNSSSGTTITSKTMWNFYKDIVSLTNAAANDWDARTRFKEFTTDGLLLEQWDADNLGRYTPFILFGDLPYSTPTYTTLRKIELNSPGIAEYKVRLIDTDGTLLTEFADWNSLVWSKILNVRHNIRFQPKSNDNRRSLFTKDRIIEVWRKNEIVGLDWYKECEGLYRTQNKVIDVSDRQSFTAFALGGIDLLVRAHIMWYEGTAQASKSGVAETVMKEFVYENVGAGALAADGRFTDNVMPNLTVEADGGLGDIWTGQKQYGNLYETLREIVDVGGVDFEVVGNQCADGYCWEFKTHYLERDDRTIDNTAGNEPVIFEAGRGNMRLPVFSRNATLERNVVYAIGQGRGTDALIVTEENGTAIAETPWNRIEMTIRPQNESNDEATLQSMAIQRLAEEEERVSLNFDVMQTRSTYYGLHYFHGDRVTSIFDGEQIDKKIRVIKGIISDVNQGEQLSVEFENVPGVGGFVGE